MRPEDWVQDAILERNRRIRAERRLNEALHNGRGRMGIWLYAQARRALNASQSWLVVSLVGACSHPHP